MEYVGQGNMKIIGEASSCFTPLYLKRVTTTYTIVDRKSILEKIDKNLEVLRAMNPQRGRC